MLSKALLLLKLLLLESGGVIWRELLPSVIVAVVVDMAMRKLEKGEGEEVALSATKKRESRRARRGGVRSSGLKMQ